MKPLTAFEMWYGRDDAPPEVVKLRAGRLEAEFLEGDLRYIRYAGRELVRRIYSAVRDVNWNTIPARKTNLSIDSAADHFSIQFDAFHQSGPLAFRWHASIEGRPDGTIEYSMDGVAEGDFRYCRIGFCVLHPVAGVVGRPYRAETPDGQISGVLPELIAPQLIDENGFETAIFPACSSLTVDLPGGMSVTTAFEGDLFETEDQRNWTDGSFKTYCTPIALGYPHHARAGQPFYQKVTVRAEGAGPPEPIDEPKGAPLRLTLGELSGRTLPPIGFGMPGDGGEMSARESELVSRLRPDHLRAELHFASPGWPAGLERAISAARQTGSALELALFLTDDSEQALEALSIKLTGIPVARLIVFHEAEAPVGTTSAHWLELARTHLADTLPGTPFFGGTNGNFAEINRQRPDVSAMDGIAYTINPQVHLPDEQTLIEAIEAQHDTVVTARSFSAALPISISTVTLKPPFNQAATEEEAPPAPDELPPSVDPRQMSLFAAAWTVGSIRSLALGGAGSITYYETTGWRGLLETASGSPLPDEFSSFPGMLFPVYWVFAFLADAKEAAVLKLVCSEPLLLDGLAFIKGSRLGVLVANLQPASQEVHISPVPNSEASVRHLNEDTLTVAATDPETFLKRSGSLQARARRAALTLKPYETAFVEFRLP